MFLSEVILGLRRLHDTIRILSLSILCSSRQAHRLDLPELPNSLKELGFSHHTVYKKEKGVSICLLRFAMNYLLVS